MDGTIAIFSCRDCEGKMITMMKKIIAAIAVLAIVFCIAGVMADDNGGGGGGGGSDSSSGSSGSSGSSDSSSSDDNSGSGADNSGKGSSSGSSGSSDSSGGSSKENRSGADTSASGRDSSKDATELSREHAAEVEIEHGIATIQTQETRHFSDLTSGHAGKPEDSGRHSRDAAVVAATGLSSLTSVSSPAASQIAIHAKTVEDSLSHISAAEDSIRTRNGFVTFLFGGDRAAASDIRARISEDNAALDAMDKLLEDPSISPALKEFTRQRETVIRAELERLKGIAEAEMQKKGLLG
jgi:hypothetical protein